MLQYVEILLIGDQSKPTYRHTITICYCLQTCHVYVVE